MRQRRRWCVWAGIATTTAVLAVVGGSSVGWLVWRRGRLLELNVGKGFCNVSWVTAQNAPVPPSSRPHFIALWPPEFLWWPPDGRFVQNGMLTTSTGSFPVRETHVPLWPIPVLTGLGTSALWWRARSVPPGHCPKCRYNLKGMTSRVCPECGEGLSLDAARAESAAM